MTNIKNLQMWESICRDARIGISKSFFGLRQTIVYQPTNSEIEAKEIDFSPEDGRGMKAIMETPREGLAKAVSGFIPKKVDIGNYMLEVCASRDGEFVAAQLFQFSQLSYIPVTEMIIYEGEDARTFKQMF